MWLKRNNKSLNNSQSKLFLSFNSSLGRVSFVWLLILGLIHGCKPKTQISLTPQITDRQLHVPTKTKSGLIYEYFRLGVGEDIVNGDVVTFHYIGKLENGKKFDNTYERAKPLVLKVGQGDVIQGWDEGLKLLRKGDRATLRIPPQLAYGERNLGDIPPNSTLVFDMDIIDVKKNEIYIMEDLIDKDTLKTPSGIKYIKIKEGKGVNAVYGQTVKVHYDGVLLNRKKFDSSYDRGEPFLFTVGKSEVNKAWDEIITLMNKGSKYRLIVPPNYANGGSIQQGKFPPNSTLVFDFELISY